MSARKRLRSSIEVPPPDTVIDAVFDLRAVRFNGHFYKTTPITRREYEAIMAEPRPLPHSPPVYTPQQTVDAALK